MNLVITASLVLFLAAAASALFSHFMARRIEKALPAQGQWLAVAGERIHYRSLGRGPAIVMVHGLGGQMRHFDYLPLQELASRHRIVLVDRPGSGHSPRSDDSQATLARQAQQVAAFIRAMNFPQPPLLVGHSLGGAVALGVALHDPACIAGVALIAPLTHLNPEPPAIFRPLTIRSPLLRRLYAQVLAVPLGIARGRQALQALFGPHREPRDFGFKGGGLLSLRPSSFYSASTDMCAIEHDLRLQQERYGELAVPVHILHGDGDRILDWRLHGEGLQQKVSHARLDVIPGGHMLPVSAPEQTTAWLQRAAEATWDPAQ